jgi:hypothetical protein
VYFGCRAGIGGLLGVAVNPSRRNRPAQNSEGRLKKIENFLLSLRGVVVAVGLLLVALIALLKPIDQLRERMAKPQAAPTVEPGPKEPPTALPTAAPNPCRYDRGDDYHTILAVIDAEVDAVKQKNLDIIRTVFFSDAVIKDAAASVGSTEPIRRYSELFAMYTYLEANHIAVVPKQITPDDAWLIGGSHGVIRLPTGELFEYSNRQGADHWTLHRDATGCWRIKEFVFNNDPDVPFP